MVCGGKLEWGPFSEEGERAFMEPDLLRPWADTAQSYATCCGVAGLLLHSKSRSERPYPIQRRLSFSDILSIGNFLSGILGKFCS